MPGRTARNGYAGGHPQERRRWAALVAAGQAVCSRCGLPVVDGKIRLRSGRLVSNWALDHSDDRSTYLGVAHRGCNARAGARKSNRSPKRRMRRRPRPVAPGVFGPLSS